MFGFLACFIWEPPAPSAVGLGLTEQNSKSRGPTPLDRPCFGLAWGFTSLRIGSSGSASSGSPDEGYSQGYPEWSTYYPGEDKHAEICCGSRVSTLFQFRNNTLTIP